MIAIDLNNKRIRVSQANSALYAWVPYEIYIALAALWYKSPWLPGDAPVGYDSDHRCLVVAKGWQLHNTDRYGDIVEGSIVE